MATQGILNQTQYKDPRANVLYGAGNKNITDDDIRSFISGAANEKQIFDTALQYGVSAQQIANAMGGQGGYTLPAIHNYIESQGVTRDLVTQPNQPLLNTGYQPVQAPKALQTQPSTVARPSTITPKEVVNQEVVYDPATDTTEGRLDSLLSDPNAPLLQRAQALANQQSQRRGLLNSSIGATAGTTAMIDTALQVATPDAQAYQRARQQNAQQALQASQANAELGLRGDIANVDFSMQADRFNADAYNQALREQQQREHQIATQSLSHEQQRHIMHLDTQLKQQLTEHGFNLDRLLETDRNAATMYRDYQQQVVAIHADPNMSPEAKQNALNNLNETMTQGLGIIGAANRLGLATAFGGQPNTGAQPPAGQQPPGLAQLSVNGNQPAGSSQAAAQGMSALTGAPLGPAPNNPAVFNTLTQAIPTQMAEQIAQAYGVDPRYLVGQQAIDQMSAQAVGGQSGGVNRLQNAQIAARLRQGIESGQIQVIPTRDPEFGMPLFGATGMDREFYYDPNNFLGLRQ